MEKTIIKLLVAILAILALGGITTYSRVANIDNNVNKYCFTTDYENR